MSEHYQYSSRCMDCVQDNRHDSGQHYANLGEVQVPAADWVTVEWNWHRTDVNAPVAAGVDDVIRGEPNPKPWRVTRLAVTVVNDGEPNVTVLGVPLNGDGSPDRRATYASTVFVPDEVEAAFVASAKERVR